MGQSKLQPPGSGALYDSDVLSWSEQQAEALRRLARGERVNVVVDWPHVIEEIEDVGRSELRACGSLLQQAMVHLLKLHAWPESQSAAHWHGEAGTFLDDAARCFTPSMRQRIDVADLYARALRRATTARDVSGPQRGLPAACPFTLDEMLAGDIGPLIASLNAAS